MQFAINLTVLQGSFGVPLYDEDASAAGLPVDAEDFSGDTINLDKEMIQNVSSTYFARIKEAGENEIGLKKGDAIILDKAIKPEDGQLLLCSIEGAFELRRFRYLRKIPAFISLKENKEPLFPKSDPAVRYWGVITYWIRKI